MSGKGPDWRKGTNYKAYWDNFPDMSKTSDDVKEPDDILSSLDPLWTLDEGIEVVREFERFLMRLNNHTALGGSVLHKGQSFKDLDIFIYPRKSNDSEVYDSGYIMKKLEKIGVTEWQYIARKDREGGDEDDDYPDNKIVYKCLYRNKRVDVFFVY